MDNKAEE